MTDNTKDLLIKHFNTYPKLQICDIFKFLHQSVFGPEHLISHPSSAEEYIEKEALSCISHKGEIIEELDGDFCRVHLDFIKDGLSPKTLSKLFFLSAKNNSKTADDLNKKLNIALDMAKNNLFSFSYDEMQREAEEWKAKGFCALHHSPLFREEYSPSYRVIKKEYAMFLPLFKEIDIRLKNETVNLAIEGKSGSGKSTLGDLLASVYNCTLFHTDVFFLRPEQRTPERFAEAGGNMDRERFLSEILVPLSQNKPVCYRPFSCSTFSLMPAINTSPCRLNVVEGAYSMHPDLSGYYNLSVFLDISVEKQKERIKKRNPDMADMFFTRWIPLEEIYFKKLNIKEKCDLVFHI